MPTAQQVPLVVAAVHHASHTLPRLAWAQEDEIRTAAQAGRILATTRSLPDDFDIPHPHTRAPRGRVDQLLSQCRDAGQASYRATVSVAEVAEMTGATSQILATVMAAETGHDRDEVGCCAENSQTSASAELVAPGLAGPVERALLGLGVTRPDLLRRAAKLDSERLIVNAAADREVASNWPDAVALNTSAATAALVNHALASGDPALQHFFVSLTHKSENRPRPSPDLAPG